MTSLPPRREIRVNAFNMNCVGHINHGLWTHPRDTSGDYRRLDYWTSLAKTLEQGLFDGLFLADILGTYDIYGGSVDLTLREAVQLPVNDPILLISAMAAVTENLGFGVTVNVNQEPPYTFARRMSTLDHLTSGRIGWNIVTGYLDSAARAVGREAQTGHDLRYDQADDYLEVLYKLWEGSWDDDAVRRDKAARIFSDPAKVHRIVHNGPFYSVDGYHLSEPSPQRTPLLYQAGTSGRGQRFAARHAECVFIGAQTPEAARKTSQAIRAACVAAGRQPDDVKIFVGISVIAAKTSAEAKEKLDDYLSYASPEAGLAHFSASTGLDFARFGLDEPISYGDTNSIQSATTLAQTNRWTKRDLLAQLALGGRYPLITGNAAEVADALERWIDIGDIDGFNLTRLVTPESYTDFASIVVPELQSRGRYKTAYSAGTLRQKTFGAGDRLPERHVAARFRHPVPAAQ